MFSTPLRYDRRTGTFIELSGGECDAEDEQKASRSCSSSSILPPCGTTDDDRERTMMLCAKTERLPMFRRHRRLFKQILR